MADRPLPEQRLKRVMYETRKNLDIVFDLHRYGSVRDGGNLHPDTDRRR